MFNQTRTCDKEGTHALTMEEIIAHHGQEVGKSERISDGNVEDQVIFSPLATPWIDIPDDPSLAFRKVRYSQREPKIEPEEEEVEIQA